MRIRILHVLFFFLFLTLLIGCGEKLPYEVVSIRGTVTFEGKPAPKGLRLLFTPAKAEGRTSEAIVGDDGKFKAIYTRSVEGIQVGKTNLTVSWGGGTGLPAPPAAVAIVETFGAHTKGFPLEITKRDKDFKIELK